MKMRLLSARRAIQVPAARRFLPVIAIVLFACLALLPGQAAAGPVFDDFESYAVGSNLHGQGGWTGWAYNTNAGALVASNFWFSPTRSANITGASDLVHTFFGATNGQWVFSTRQYIPSTSSGTTYVILLNRYQPPYATTNDLNWSVQIQCNMTNAQIISDVGGGAPLPMVKNQWVEIRCEINLASNSVSEFYNGQLLSTHPWQDGTGVNEIQALDLFANNAAPVYYDNVTLTQMMPPFITQQPQSQFVPVGSNATFTVVATGTPPLRYQWRLNRAAILDATNAVLTVFYSGSTNLEIYDVVVTNDYGSTVSDPARNGPEGSISFSGGDQKNVCGGEPLFSLPDGTIDGQTLDSDTSDTYSPIYCKLEQLSGPFTLGSLAIEIDHNGIHHLANTGVMLENHVSGSPFSHSFTVWAAVPGTRNNSTPLINGDTAKIQVSMQYGYASTYPASPAVFDFVVNYNLSVSPSHGLGCCWNFALNPRCLAPTTITKIVAQIINSPGAKIQSAAPLGTIPIIPAVVDATATLVTWNLGTPWTFPQTPNICFECGNTAGIQVRFKGYNSANNAVVELNETVTVSAPACQDTTPPTIIVCPGPITDCSGMIPNVIPLFTAFTVSDNCSSFAQLVITQTPMANSPANYGPNSITVTVKDQAGNPSSCLVVFNATPPPGTLTIQQIPGSGWGGIDVKLTWTGGGFVEFTDDLNSGYWWPLVDQLTGLAPTSPYTFPADMPGGRASFRLHCP